MRSFIRRFPLVQFSCRLYHSDDGGHHPPELGDFSDELLPAKRSQLIKARPPIVFRPFPFRDHPTFYQHPLQSRIQRAFFYLQHIVRDLLDMLCDPIAMERPLLRESLEDEHIKRTGWDLRPFHRKT